MFFFAVGIESYPTNNRQKHNRQTPIKLGPWRIEFLFTNIEKTRWQMKGSRRAYG